MLNDKKHQIFSDFVRKAFLKAGTIQIFPQKLVLVTLAILLIWSPLVSDLIINKNSGSDNSVAEAASLSEVELLTDVTIDAELSDPAAGEPYNLNLNLNGTGLADAELVSPDRTVVFHAPELAGQLQHSGGTATVQVDILPINLEEDLPALNTTLVGLQDTLSSLVTGLLTGIDNALPALIPPSLVEVNGIDELNSAIDNLNNLNTALADVLSYNDAVQYTVNDDGTIVVSFTDGLGNHLETAVVDIVQSALNDVSNAVNNLEINILSGLPIVGGLLDELTNGLLIPLIGDITGAVTDVSIQLTEGTLDLSNSLASAQVIGNTNVNLDVLVNNPPGDVEGTTPVLGAGIQDSVIDVALLNSLQSQDTVTFPEQADEVAPVLGPATIEGTSETGYTVSGTGEEPGDTVNVTNADGTNVGTGTIDADGNYSIALTEPVSPNEVLDVQAIDEAGNESNTVQVTVPDDPDATAPVLNSADIEGTSETGYTVSGTGEEPGDTVNVYNSDDVNVGTGTIDADGNYSIALTEAVSPNEVLDVQAIDEAGNESEALQVKVPEDPDTTPPELDNVVIEGDSTDGYEISGLTEPDAMVIVQDLEGNEIGTGESNSEGNFTVAISANDVGEGDELTVVARDEADNESAPTTLIVPEDPDTTPPVLNNVLIEGSSKENYIITGNTEPDAKIIVKDGNNEIGTTVADGQGNFSIDISSENVQPLDELSLTATDDSGNESEPTTVEVPENQLVIESVPDIVFETTEIKDEEMIIGRQENNSVIDIIDTRKNETWSLTAQVENALQNSYGDVLPGSFIYMNDGQEIYLEDAAKVATKEDARSDGVMDRITWSGEEGIFLKTNPIEAVAGSEYSTTIEWTLSNGP